MFARLGIFVTRHWLVTLLAWGVLTIALSLQAPRWEDIALDGDFAYLPPNVSSNQAESLLEAAFNYERARSQVAVVVSSSDGPLSEQDLQQAAYDIARRLQNAFGVVASTKAFGIQRELESRDAPDKPPAAPSSDDKWSTLLPAEYDGSQWTSLSDDALQEQLAEWRQRATVAFDEAVTLDSLLAYPRPEQGPGSRWATPLWNLAQLQTIFGDPDASEAGQEFAIELDPALKNADGMVPREAALLPVLDLWTWRDEIFGEKLRSESLDARLLLLQLREEFLAVGNMQLVQFLQRQVEETQAVVRQHGSEHIHLGLSGSAAVGGDLLMGARESIRQTEWLTIVLVIGILAFVYRSPLLIVAPLITILVSLKVSTSIVALLTLMDHLPGFPGGQLHVFTTSKIFIVVILFGAGTDFCLFLISRCRETIGELPARDAVAHAVEHVGEALTASALTTVLGLLMMIFADFGKFRSSGPMIGLCLLVTLAACLTLTPALLCLLGGFLRPARTIGEGDHSGSRFWRAVAKSVTRHPWRLLLLTAMTLAPLAAWGVMRARHVSYDFLAGLSPRAVSRQGAELMKKSFPIGESGPVMVVAQVLDPVLESSMGREQVARLNYLIHDVTGVVAVRSLADPLGETSREDLASLLSPTTLETRFARYHERTAELFLAQNPGFRGRVTRFEVVMDADPFSPAAIEILESLEDALAHASVEDPFWAGANFYVSGTTAGIRDLADITTKDTERIEWLVVLAVFLVLLAILRRPVICLYLVGSVLLSYFVTVGVIDLVFASFAPNYPGLDWKVPLFLFVILVAVGQDYNVYLVTRVFEESETLGPIAGLRAAVERTGGIITSCGVIMAGTFLSMTGAVWTSALKATTGWNWIPDTIYLQGIVQLGAALALGVMLDTLIVRSVLVPAFLAIWTRWRYRH